MYRNQLVEVIGQQQSNDNRGEEGNVEVEEDNRVTASSQENKGATAGTCNRWCTYRCVTNSLKDSAILSFFLMLWGFATAASGSVEPANRSATAIDSIESECVQEGERPRGRCFCWTDGVCRSDDVRLRSRVGQRLMDALEDNNVPLCEGEEMAQTCLDLESSIDLALLYELGPGVWNERDEHDLKDVYGNVTAGELIIEGNLYVAVEHITPDVDRNLEDCGCSGRWTHEYTRVSTGNVLNSRYDIEGPSYSVHRGWQDSPSDLICMGWNEYYEWSAEGSHTARKLTKKHTFNLMTGSYEFKQTRKSRWEVKLGVRCVGTNLYGVGVV